jgi:hypothetical protein
MITPLADAEQPAGMFRMDDGIEAREPQTSRNPLSNRQQQVGGIWWTSLLKAQTNSPGKLREILKYLTHSLNKFFEGVVSGEERSRKGADSDD